MIRPSGRLTAELRAAHVDRAVRAWRAALTGEALPWGKNNVVWNEELGFWSYFGRTDADTPRGWRYWNIFGTRPRNFRSNMIVEINPPLSEEGRNNQGLIANDAQGNRWILHGGQLHPPGQHVTAAEFAEITGRSARNVLFPDGRTKPYFLVAPLDAGAGELAANLASYVEVCSRVRDSVVFGRDDAAREARVRGAEAMSKPESGGRYIIPARGSVTAERVHGKIWKALVCRLDELGVAHSNARVGRFGPDLRTLATPRLLFEIKTDASPRSVYEALGQLLLYETFLGSPFAKAMVAPASITSAMTAGLKSRGVDVIQFEPAGRGFHFDDRILLRLLKIKSAR